MSIKDVTTNSIAELISLKGRNAVVTGGARGLGRAISERLSEAGANVLLGDLDEAGASNAASEISAKTGAKVLAAKLDVTDSSSITALANKAVEAFGSLDIWVNNAGIFPLTPVLDMSDEDWDSVLDVNLRGAFIGSREAARKMSAHGNGGVIINISSTSGFNGGGPSVTHYVASKHGIQGVTMQMALELASQGIRVLGVAPWVIVTEGVKHAMAGAAAEAGFDLTPNSMLGRAGVPDDIARVVLFCASDLSIFMTGTTMPVDAGFLTQ